MKKNSYIFIITLFLMGMLYGIHNTFADVTVKDGSVLTLNRAILDMNCTDIIVADGGTLDLGNGVVDELGEKTVNPGGAITGSGTTNPCSGDGPGTVVVNSVPNEIRAPWILECADGYNNGDTGDQTLTDVPAGECTITWGHVEGYAFLSPNPAVQYLSQSGTVTFSGSYERVSGGDSDVGTCFINTIISTR